MNRMHIVMSLVSSVALLAGCGGGGGDAPAPAPAPAATDALSPDASASAAGLKKYLTDLAAMPVEQKEPLALDGFVPPTSEDTEPESVS